MERLQTLHGTWRGSGSGDYPTIEAFRYDETLRFEYDPSYPMIHYEQRAWLKPDGQASHWESGFIRVVDGGIVEVSSAQDSGRVEVLSGRAFVDDGDDDLRLELDSVVLAHDPRLERTRRIITMRGDTLRYVKWMATHTTSRPELLQHLEAELGRSTEAGSR